MLDWLAVIPTDKMPAVRLFFWLAIYRNGDGGQPVAHEIVAYSSAVGAFKASWHGFSSIVSTLVSGTRTPFLGSLVSP